MPNHDGTGPDGKGPMTGCGRGNCMLKISNSEQELDFLTNQAHVLETQLKRIRTRIRRAKIKKEVHHAGV